MGLQTFFGTFTQSRSDRKTFEVTVLTPGPGAYNVSKDITKTYKKSFGKDAKLQLKDNNVPPLGKYKVVYKQVIVHKN